MIFGNSTFRDFDEMEIWENAKCHPNQTQFLSVHLRWSGFGIGKGCGFSFFVRLFSKIVKLFQFIHFCLYSNLCPV